MSEIFGPEPEFCPELEIFEALSNPGDAEEAIQLYHSYLRDGLSHQEAKEIAVTELVPSIWSEISEDQPPEQPSS